MHQSVATISSPQFINLAQLDINPMMSSCEIKVLYVGQNRNQSYITKEVATEMAKTLRGAPIVGYYKKDKQDFADHGDQVVIDDEGVKFNCLTVPYGFVSPDAKVWFQEFEDVDDFGHSITREYLMTTGYLWTGQFEEAKQALEGDGRPQSMELDGESLDGHWSIDSTSGMEYYIINDATFSKLCILGEDVEPCFEGSTITAPNVSNKFSLDDKFTKTLYNMMQDLKFALKEGGNEMTEETPIIEESTPVVEEISETVDKDVETVAPEIEETTESTSSENAEVVDAAPEVAVEASPVEAEATAEFTQQEETVEYAKAEEKKESEEEEKPSTEKEEEKKSDSSEDKSEKDDKEDKYSLLEEQYKELEAKFTALTAERDALAAYKAQIEDAQKDELINSFYSLDEADKKEVIENKSKYSLEEIEAKLSVIYTRKNMSVKETQKTDKASVVTYNFAEEISTEIPDWVKAVQDFEKQM